MNNNGIPSHSGGYAHHNQYNSPAPVAPAQPSTVHAAMPETTLRMQGRYSHAVVVVKPRTLENLHLADKVQRHTQRLLPHGAGNQWLSVLSSQGESYSRGHLTRELKPEFRKQNPQIDRTYNSARAAATLQGGNCQEFADIAYTLLAARGANTPVFHVSYRNDHILVMLGDPRESSENVALVDAWPSIPVATTLSNSLINPNDLVVKKQFNSRSGNPDAQAVLSGIRPMSSVEVNQRMQAQGFPAIGPALVQELAECLKEEGQFFYDVRTLSADPSMKYTDGHQHPESFDRMSSNQLAGKLAVVREYEQKVQTHPDLYGRFKGI
ncbi:hypothetical protein [Pseudomonas agarici]|uniref:hypothetical protein n=1 Tax=Pseudomonas agarici TaxID=46677 RepID=UPI0008B0BC75|nr:hypothetical protein [Pseudomonas agarici]NWB93171.1 hypothetical protein [Pseudomonas agarici]NWC08455.1 hypothetical protein [Pseudomonas agarici]SEK67448.1 hypothetical protein SAMN05216604_105133 [Pseudomonas agarici]